MVACARSTCRKELHDSWRFCPYCGQDCRPPAERRVAIQACHHEYFGELPFCVQCGYSVVEGRAISRIGDPIKFRWAIGITIASFVCFGFSIFLMWLIEGAHGPAQVLVDQAEAGKDLDDPIAKQRGTSVASPILAITGFVGLIVAYFLWQSSRAQPMD